MQKYYDLEYGKVVTDDYIKKQYKHFCEYVWFIKTYGEFKKDNFILITDKNKYLFMQGR